MMLKEIEKRPYLLVGLILMLMLVYVDFQHFGINKTVGLAYDLEGISKLLCLVSLVVSFVSYFILSICKLEIVSSISYTYVFTILFAVAVCIYTTYYFLVFSFSFISIIVLILNVMIAVIKGKKN